MPRQYKSRGSFSAGRSAAAVARSRSMARRGKITGAARGYLRTGGFYGRYRAPGRLAQGTELKFFDGVNSTAAVGVGGTIAQDSLNEIAQGVGESQRVGRKCTLKKLNMRGECTLPAATNATNTSDRLRLVVYHDKQTNGAAAAVTDILESATQDSFLNLANKGRFRILAEKNFTMSAAGATASGAAYTYGEVVKSYKLNINLNTPIEFDGATGAITEMRTNNIGVLLISDSGLCSCVFRWRVRYADN